MVSFLHDRGGLSLMRLEVEIPSPNSAKWREILLCRELFCNPDIQDRNENLGRILLYQKTLFP